MLDTFERLVIEIRNLTKRFGKVVAVDDLSFDVRPGRVTGFLGPNGSGKSTTMRCMVGLDRADGGTTAFDGRRYESFRRPLYEVGSCSTPATCTPARSGRNHLRWLAATNGMPSKRVDEVLDLVGLTEVAERRCAATRSACGSGSASPACCSAIRTP